MADTTAVVEIDQRKLRLYKYQLDNQMVTLDKIPEPYKTELSK